MKEDLILLISGKQLLTAHTAKVILDADPLSPEMVKALLQVGWAEDAANCIVKTEVLFNETVVYVWQATDLGAGDNPASTPQRVDLLIPPNTRFRCRVTASVDMTAAEGITAMLIGETISDKKIRRPSPAGAIPDGAETGET